MRGSDALGCSTHHARMVALAWAAPRAAAACADAELVYDESSFRLAMNADLAATTKLAEGINAFIGETAKLQAAIEAKV